VANKIRLLNLPEEIQEGVVEGKLTERHARALLNVPPEKQKDVYHHILDADMNVRETETYIEKIITPKVKKRRHKTKGYSRNIQIGLNSVAQCIKLIEKMGITVRSETKETDDDVHVVITFPKNKGE
ncbi:MAG: nucleoid occlusion protein, partial [Solobacterium sp.]|nr:nucleoid occlusion protein [Solobacterium sp.]